MAAFLREEPRPGFDHSHTLPPSQRNSCGEQSMRVSVEVCVTSVDEALAAERAGVDSVEVCSWLACGGLTPSYGLVNTLKEHLKLTMRVLVRPTPGGFFYKDLERQAILRDSMLIGINGMALVAGGLDKDDDPERVLLKGILLAAPDSEITFHRAIDRARNRGSALDLCLQLGVHRVLTSGGETLAMDGLRELKRSVEQVKGQLKIAAAGGIDPKNVVEIVEKTGVSEVHFSAQRPRMVKVKGAAMSSTNADVNFETEPDVAKIEGVLNALSKAGLR